MRTTLVVVLFLALAAPARASTAEIVIGDTCDGDVACSKYNGGQSRPIVTYSGAPGDANRLTVGRDGVSLTFSDPAATITAKSPCVSIDAHTASCDDGMPAELGMDGLAVLLGDGDDTLTVAVPEPLMTTLLSGGDGDDALTGGAEDDLIDPGPGADRVDGASGLDTLSFASRPDGVTVDLATSRTSDGDVFASIERVQGGDGPDHLLGGPRHDELYGGSGDDVISGRGGDDSLTGELGADHLDGGRGIDVLDGDPMQGDDYYAPRFRLSRDVLRGGPGGDTLFDSGGDNLLEGGTGPDMLSGGSGRDRLVGGPGDDYLLGHRGADRLSGGAGRDVMEGGAGADRLSGGSLPDRLVGGLGADRLFGGPGNDSLFGIDRSHDRLECGHGHDHAWYDGKDGLHACEILRRGGYTPFR
jgi:Ca2+-binding RTX toxin-like protein